MNSETTMALLAAVLEVIQNDAACFKAVYAPSAAI